MRIPAVCGQCGLAFLPNAIDVGPGGTIGIESATTNCPGCGGTAQLLSGIYTNVENALRVVLGTGLSQGQFEQLTTRLREFYRLRTGDSGAAADAIERAVPGLKTLRDWLPNDRPELYAFLGMLIAALTLLYQAQSQDKSSSSTERGAEINVTINALGTITDKQITEVVQKAVQFELDRQQPETRMKPSLHARSKLTKAEAKKRKGLRRAKKQAQRKSRR